MVVCMLELESVWKSMECDVGMDSGGYIRLRCVTVLRLGVRWVSRRDGCAQPNGTTHNNLIATTTPTTSAWLASARTSAQCERQSIVTALGPSAGESQASARCHRCVRNRLPGGTPQRWREPAHRHHSIIRSTFGTVTIYSHDGSITVGTRPGRLTAPAAAREAQGLAA